MMNAENQNFSPPQIEDSDMRYFPRWEVNNRVLYHLEGDKKQHEGQTKDISCAGACITGAKEISPHQKIEVTVNLADGVKVKLKAHILWVRIENNHASMGVTFYDTPDEAQNLILQHAFELDRDKFVQQLYKGWENLNS
jgi:c-di-GMP-binding flagellar brake protein YcgR